MTPSKHDEELPLCDYHEHADKEERKECETKRNETKEEVQFVKSIILDSQPLTVLERSEKCSPLGAVCLSSSYFN